MVNSMIELKTLGVSSLVQNCLFERKATTPGKGG